MIQKIIRLNILTIILILTSCAANYRVPDTYQLTAVNEKSYVTKPVKTTVLVSMPQVASGYQSDSMLYITKNYTLSSFVNSTWDTPPSEMLQPLLNRSLQNTHYFYAVFSGPSPAQSDLRIDTTLVKLQQNFTQKPSLLEMSIDVVLINSKSFKVVASKNFSANVTASTDNPYGGVIAANEACQQIMENISSWTVKEASAYSKGP